MAEKFVSTKNLRFLLHEVFHTERLTEFEYYSDHSRETFDLALDTAFRISKDLLHPRLQEMDKNPPEFKDGVVRVHPLVKEFIREAGAGGWIAANASYELDGQQLPFTVTSACHFIFGAANYSASVYPLLMFGAAHLIDSFGSEDLKREFIPRMLSGKWQGTMALTEPQAGSSLGDLQTQALITDQDYYLIRGQKIFISAGDHDAVENVVHLMLARIKSSPPGVKGVSLFVVPKRRFNSGGTLVSNDVNVSALYHKLGYRGAPIVQLSLGENDDCRGYLVGAANNGLSYMFQMMNEARLEVGLGAASIASAAYQASLEYAKERRQGRKVSEKNPESEPVRIIEHSDVRRMLLFQKAVVEGSLSLVLQCCLYSDLAHVRTGDLKERYSLLLDLLTPAAKTYPSEMGVLSVSQGLQVLGGYGFCDEFPLEQFYRDIRIHPIHEGSTGIQGMDLLGRKIVMNGGKAFSLFLEEVGATIKSAKNRDSLKPYAEKLDDALNSLRNTTFGLTKIGSYGRTENFLADATLYLELFSIVAIAWQWLKQGIVATRSIEASSGESDKAFYSGKLVTMKYFFHYELPKTKGLLERLSENDGLTVNFDENWLED
jgi:alkylation response protein AidB-like acyl-CoA dehydrogenase